MRKSISTLMLLILLVGSFGLAFRIEAATPVPYFRPHDESPTGYFTLFKNLCDAHPRQADYLSIGKSYLGNDIWMFRIGNPNGGIICWTAAMHGWEDMGTEVMYLYAKWLLETNSTETNNILNNNYALLIPVVNVDRLAKHNANYSSCSIGVNLHRNFPTKWSYVSRAQGEANNDYHGPYPLSESEAIAVHSVFETYRPIFYLDAHYGGGGVTGTGMCYSTISQPDGTYVGKPMVNEFVTKYKELARTHGVPAYWFNMNARASGFPSTDADGLGATAFLLEVAGEGPSVGLCYNHEAPGQSLEDIRTFWFPKCLPIFLAMNSLSARAISGDVDADGKVDMKDVSTVAKAFGSSEGQSLYNLNCDILYDGTIDMKDIAIVVRNFGRWPVPKLV